MEDEKLGKLIKAYNMPKKNCWNLLTPKCNDGIWRNDLKVVSQRSNAIVLQKKHLLIVKVGCAMADAWDIMDIKLNFDQWQELKTHVTDSLALASVVSGELSQFRKDQLKSCLPSKMQPLVKNILTDLEWQFENGLYKWISLLKNILPTLEK